MGIENVRDKNGVPTLKAKEVQKKTTPKAHLMNIEVPDALNGYVAVLYRCFVAYNTEYSAGVPIGDYLRFARAG